MFLFSGACPSAYIKQSLSIHSISGNVRKPVKKMIKVDNLKITVIKEPDA